MTARLLSLLAVLGMVLAPFLPAQRLYVCTMDGQVRSECCCQHAMGGMGADAVDASSCCKVITVVQFLAPGHCQPGLPPIDACAAALDLPEPLLVAMLPRLELLRPPLQLQPPPRPSAQLFVRYCSWLT